MLVNLRLFICLFHFVAVSKVHLEVVSITVDQVCLHPCAPYNAILLYTWKNQEEMFLPRWLVLVYGLLFSFHLLLCIGSLATTELVSMFSLAKSWGQNESFSSSIHQILLSFCGEQAHNIGCSLHFKVIWEFYLKNYLLLEEHGTLMMSLIFPTCSAVYCSCGVSSLCSKLLSQMSLTLQPYCA